ncbi:hypothetical protein D6201_03205 [Aurantiacibacter aquimixticola]|uniref:Uncharacterized protein n=2 Tax=Aurantiacibacter aquimixticola TaxID=1958945 RepID=A0A419RRT6_9SPHN|nr:hypothetical protein D6201_03205 [Aurantiacibacter aquimixticola]
MFVAPLLVAADRPQQETPDAPFDEIPAEQAAGIVADPDIICRDTIQQVREARDLPELEREPADPNEAILFKALAHRIDGCDVLLVGNGDIRPIPAPAEGPVRPIPAQ